MYIIFICIVHYFILNPFEKVYFSYHLNNTNRPLEKCKDTKYSGCNGFPSGHAEITIIICFYLLFNKMISVPIAILILIAVCSQRLITRMHSLDQVIYGTCFGIIYSYLYWVTNFSSYSLLISLTVMIILTILIHRIIKSYINEPVPNWVDPVMYDKINEKKNINMYYQIAPIYEYLSNNTNTIFISWREVEELLDKAIIKIKHTGIQYDGIVGIKSGGAIVSDYISKKLNIKNYKIKVKHKKHAIDNSVTEFIRKRLFNGEYTINDEDNIGDQVLNKNIILIDECIFTGVTMDVVIDYLKPKVANLYPIVLSGNGVYHVELVKTNFINIWPWGYDN